MTLAPWAHLQITEQPSVFQFDEYKVNSDSRRCRRILLNALRFAVPGIGVFILLPSTVFYYVESGWTYLDCVYYAFVSLTTIGYGDLISKHHGHEVEARLGRWVWAYQTFTIVWLVFGLSFVFMINILMMDRIRGALKKYTGKLMQSSKKSARKLRKFAESSSMIISESSLTRLPRSKKVMPPKTPLKRAQSAPCRYRRSSSLSRAWEDARERSLTLLGHSLDIYSEVSEEHINL